MIINISADTVLTASQFPSDVTNEDIYLMVDSTLAAVAITLPDIASLSFLNPRLYVHDVAGTAGTNNITILADAASADRINGNADEATSLLTISTAFGSAKLQAVSVSDWIGSVVTADAGSYIALVGSVLIAGVNAGAAAATYTETFADGKIAGFYVQEFFSKVNTAFASVTRPAILKSVGMALGAGSTNVDLATASRVIAGSTQSEMVASQKADIEVVLEFGGGGNNPKDFTTGRLDVYARFAKMPV